LSLQAGEQKAVQFTLNRHDLSFIGIDLTRQTEPGLFIVTVGNLRANFTLIGGDGPVNSTPRSKSINHQYLIFLINILLFLFAKLI
ncbi:unnamed protein product, partial [Rotaria sordida]